jgi:membrane-associated phospholipid phosphatase
MPRRALYGAACGGGLLILTWVLAFHVGVFERADQSVYSGFGGLKRPHVDPVALWIAKLCDPQPYVYLTGIPVLIALLRRRPRLALTVAAIMVGANVTTQLLKPLLAEPRAASLFGGHAPVGPVSWPSGHATAAMSLALCFVLAAPGRLRPAAAALGAVFAVAVSYSFLTLGWHYPSDVFGGFLVAGTWTLLGVAALSAVYGKRAPHVPVADPVPLREALRPPAFALLGALALGALIALARPHAVISYVEAHRAFTVGAAAIGAFGLTVATAVMLTVRGSLSGTSRVPKAAPRPGWRRG